jgi:hypothetical protein
MENSLMASWPDIAYSAIPPLHVAERLASDVRRAVFGSDRTDVACDLKAICVAGGFVARKLLQNHDSTVCEAMLVPRISGGFEIFVDSGLSDPHAPERVRRQRRRFRVAHEIAHSFFYDRSSTPAKRLLSGSEQEEQFCDAFASALLVPPTAARSLPCAAASVIELQERYDVSAQVAGLALSQVDGEVWIVGLAPKQLDKDIQPELRVLWSTGPGFVPKHARLNSVTVLGAAAHGFAQSPNETLSVGALRGAFAIEAVRPTGRAIVIAVIRRNETAQEDDHAITRPGREPCSHLEHTGTTERVKQPS